MKDLIITPPDGYEIDQEKSTFDHIVFKEVVKEKIVKTWEEIMQLKKGTMYYLNSYGEASGYDMNSKVILSSTASAHVNTRIQTDKLRALAQLFVIMDHYNGDYDFADKDRYFPCWDLVDNKMNFDDLETYFQHPIYFKSLEASKEAYNNNKEIFETFFKP